MGRGSRLLMPIPEPSLQLMLIEDTGRLQLLYSTIPSAHAPTSLLVWATLNGIFGKQEATRLWLYPCNGWMNTYIWIQILCWKKNFPCVSRFLWTMCWVMYACIFAVIQSYKLCFCLQLPLLRSKPLIRTSTNITLHFYQENCCWRRLATDSQVELLKINPMSTESDHTPHRLISLSCQSILVQPIHPHFCPLLLLSCISISVTLQPTCPFSCHHLARLESSFLGFPQYFHLFLCSS